MIRKLFVVSALVAGSSLLTAAPSAADTAPIAAVLKTLSNPYWVAMRDGIAAEAKKRGVSVDIVSGNSEDDIEGQQRLMEDVVNKNYKGIIVAPISPVSLIPAIVKANHKGITSSTSTSESTRRSSKPRAAVSSRTSGPTT